MGKVTTKSVAFTIGFIPTEEERPTRFTKADVIQKLLALMKRTGYTKKFDIDHVMVFNPDHTISSGINVAGLSDLRAVFGKENVPKPPYRVRYTLSSRGKFIVNSLAREVRVWGVPNEGWKQVCFLPYEWLGKRVNRHVTKL